MYCGEVKRNQEAGAAIAGNDEELQEAVAKWMSRGKYERVLEVWVKGWTVDWELLYGSTKPRRMSLPTYPFLPDRYWEVHPHKVSADVPGNGHSPFAESVVDQLLRDVVDEHLSIDIAALQALRVLTN
jgi:acyl transferase domain-containing protein